MVPNKPMLKFFLLILPFSLSAVEHYGWYSGKCWGWDYGEIRMREEEQDLIPPPTSAEQVELIQRSYKEALAEATLNPTMENVLKVKQIQQGVVNRMSAFGNMWALVSLLHPELDDSVMGAPDTGYGIRAFREQEKEQRDRKIQAIAKESFLVYVYEGDNFISERMSSIILGISQQYNWSLTGISLDGKDLPGLKEVEGVRPFINKQNLVVVPALYMVFEDGSLYPIAWGIQTVDIIQNNILLHLDGGMQCAG